MDQFTAASLDPLLIPAVIKGVSYFQQIPFLQPGISSRLPRFRTDNTFQIATFFKRNEDWLLKHFGPNGSADIPIAILESLPVWSDHNRYLVHGDFALHNLGMAGQSLVALDWEHSHISHPMYDFAKLYTTSWRYPEWRREFARQIRQISRSEDHWQLFLAGVIVRSLAEIRYLEQCLNNEEYGYSMQVKAFLTRKAAVEVFTQAIRIHEATIAHALEADI